MSSVDDRIVNMKFNNQQFIQGAADSEKALESLEGRLKSAAKGSSLDSMSSSVEDISKKFSVMGVVSATAIGKITSSVMSMGKNWVSKVISPITQGGLKRALNMEMGEFQLGGVFKMMGDNAQESADKIKSAMDAANKAVTGTAYGLDEALRLSSQFAAAGQTDFAKMEKQLRGVAGAAAMTGSSFTEIGTIFKQMASENGGMISAMRLEQFGTRGLNAWAALSAQMGKSQDQLRKMVKDREISFDQFADAMYKSFGEHAAAANDTYEGALANFNSAWARIGADFIAPDLERQRQRFITMIPIVNNLRKALWPLAAAWNNWRKETNDAINGVLLHINKLTSPGEGLEAVVKGGKELTRWTGKTGLMYFAGQLRITIYHIRMIRNALIGDLVEAFKMTFGGADEVHGAIKSVGNIILDVTKRVKLFFRGIREAVEGTDLFVNLFRVLFGVIKLLFAPIVGVGVAIKAMFAAIKGGVDGPGLNFQKFLEVMSTGLGKLADWMHNNDGIKNFFIDLGSAIGNTLGPAVRFIGNLTMALVKLFTGDIDGFRDSFDAARSSFMGFTGGLMGSLAALTSPIGVVSDWFTKLQNKIVETKFSFDSVRGATETAGETFRSAGERIKEFFNTIFHGKKNVDTVSMTLGHAELQVDRVSSAAEGLSAFMTGLFSVIGGVLGWAKRQFTDLFGDLDALEIMGVLNAMTAYGLMKSIKNITDNLGGLIEGGGVFEGIVENLKGMRDAFTEHLGAIQDTLKAKAIMSIAIAVGVLAGAAILLSFIDVGALTKGVIAIGALLAMLVFSLNMITGIGSVTGKHNAKIATSALELNLLASALIMIGVALLVMSGAVYLLSKMDPWALVQGIAGLAAMMAIMAGGARMIASSGQHVAKAGVSILIMAVALLVLTKAVEKFGTMDEKTLNQGMMTMAISMALLAGSAKLLSDSASDVAKAGGAVFLIAAALLVLSFAVEKLGKLKPKAMEQGLLSVMLLLGMITLALYTLSLAKGDVAKGSGAIILIAIALSILVPVIEKLGKMDLKVLAIGMLALAVGLAVLIAAGFLAMKVAPGLAVLALAIFAIGAAIGLAGAGMFLFATGFVILVGALVGGTAVIIASIQAFMALLPAIAMQLAAAFIAFLEVLAKAAPKIRKAVNTLYKEAILGPIVDNAAETAKAFGALLVALLDEFDKNLERVGESFDKLIDEGVKRIENNTPRLVDAGWAVVQAFADGAEENTPLLVEKFMNMLTDIVNTVNEEKDELMEAIAELITSSIEKIEALLKEHGPRIKTAATNIGWMVIEGLSLGLINQERMGKLSGAIKSLSDKIPSGIKSLLGINSPAKIMIPIGMSIAEGLSVGINNGIKLAVAAAVKMANEVLAVGDAAALAAYGRASGARGRMFQSQERVDAATRTAERAQTRADKEEKKLSNLERKRNKTKEKGKKAQLTKQIKAQNKIVRKANRQATKQDKYVESQQKIADREQAKYDEAQRAAEFRRDLALADNLGKAELYDDELARLAELSQAKLAEAQAKEAEARRLAKSDAKLRKRLLNESKKAANEARKLAREAQNAQAQAIHFYEEARKESAKAIRERISELLETKAQDEQARVDEAEYNAADTAGKVAILESRAARNDEKAKAATEAFESAISKAETLADTDAEAAEAQLEIADAQYAIAKAAIDEAKSQRDEAANLLGQTAMQGAGSGAMQASASVLAEAAKSVDRYTKSLSDAQELALAGVGTSVNYTQYNYSPEALSNATIYRQSKNLLSMAME